MMRWTSHLGAGWTHLKANALRGLAAAAVGGLLAGWTPADDAVFSNKARFRIPYQLDAAEIARIKASEIQLHVSTDHGKRWRHVDSVPPVDGKFTFEATQDGEYWFSVRTVSEDGREHPSGPLTAGLKVLVDTAPPALSLQLSEVIAGQVGLQWNATDDHLNIETLVLEYRESDNGAWETIQIVPTEAGETSWSVPAGGSIAVRGRIRDLAGNEATQQSEVSISGVAAPQMPAAPAVRRPIADGQTPADSPLTNDPFVQTPTPYTQSAGNLPLINPNGSEYSQFVSQQSAAPRSPTPQPASSGQSPTGSGHPQTTQRPAMSPPHVQVRRVNATSFQIGYVLDDVGPSGVSSIDLYLTEDNGRRWYHYGADEDGNSPFQVTVPQDGSYGFAIRVRSGVGLSQTPPQPGSAPEVMIVVDREPPQATLLPLKQGQGQMPNQLLIEWQTTDEELADRPVSLYFAPRPGGPWQPITGWEPNTGQYLWTFGPDAPKQIYIRLEARDAAGNIARVETPEPMLIDLSRPTARIIDVESLAPR